MSAMIRNPFDCHWILSLFELRGFARCQPCHTLLAAAFAFGIAFCSHHAVDPLFLLRSIRSHVLATVTIVFRRVREQLSYCILPRPKQVIVPSGKFLPESFRLFPRPKESGMTPLAALLVLKGASRPGNGLDTRFFGRTEKNALSNSTIWRRF